MSEPRKASEVLLDLEAKIDNLISLFETQNLNNKILSNKLNEIMSIINKPAVNLSKPTAEIVTTVPQINSSSFQNFQPTDPERQVAVFAEAKLPETNSPQGFRRTSRPETFSGDDAYLKQKEEVNNIPKFPLQTPKGNPPPGRSIVPEIIVPSSPVSKQSVSQASNSKLPKTVLMQNAIPVSQRIVDKNGKSVFLADVEILDISTGQPIYKTRTNGTGKWMASLSIGNFRVTIRKRESVGQDKAALEAIQDVQVKGDQSPLELQTLIIK